jgi:hypothetical protein
MNHLTKIVKKTQSHYSSPFKQNISLKLSRHIAKYMLINEAIHDLQDIMNNWTLQHELLSGGQMRQLRGESIEKFVINLINKIGITLDQNIHAIKGDNDKKELRCCTDDGDIIQQHQVDVHVYRDDKFVATIECKAYLDKCYYTRACDDFALFKKFGYDVDHYVFAFEDSIASDALSFTNFVKDNICKNIFYMVDGKRSSSKPIYCKQHTKKLNCTNIIKFINTFDIA